MTEHSIEQTEQPAEPSPQGDQSELDLGVVNTGDAGVDRALGELDQLKSLPVSGHPAIFEQVHRGLAQAMTRAGDESEQRVQPEDESRGSHGADQ